MKQQLSMTDHINKACTAANKKYKIFKAAVSTKCPEMCSKYNKARNAVTSAWRRAKASYFNNMFEEVKQSSAYWNLINRATNRSARNRTIGPLKRTDGSFALMDKEKAQMMNAYFSEIDENLIKSLPMPPQPASVDASTSLYILSPKSLISITNHSVEKKDK